MGRKKSKGKKKKGSKRAPRREGEEASDNGDTDSEQARALPPPINDSASRNNNYQSDSDEEISGKLIFNTIIDPEYVAYLKQSRESTLDDTSGDKVHESQLLDSLNALRLLPPRSTNRDNIAIPTDPEEIAFMKAKEQIALEIARTLKMNSSNLKITEHGIRLRDLLSPLLPDLPAINLELQDLPGIRNESPKKKARKPLGEADNVAKNIAMLREAAANLATNRKGGSKIKEFEAASAVDQAIALAMGECKEENSKSGKKTPKIPPLFPSNFSTGTPSLQSRNNGNHFRSVLSAASLNNSELDQSGNIIFNLNENSSVELRSNRNIASMAVTENDDSGHSNSTELDLTIARLGNLNINENSPLEGSLNNSDHNNENSAQDLLQENNNIAPNQNSTQARRDSSVRPKVKNNNSNVKKTPK